jgi:hypothetical protein
MSVAITEVDNELAEAFELTFGSVDAVTKFFHSFGP